MTHLNPIAVDELAASAATGISVSSLQKMRGRGLHFERDFQRRAGLDAVDASHSFMFHQVEALPLASSEYLLVDNLHYD